MKKLLAALLLITVVGCCKPQAAPCPRLPEPSRPELRVSKLPPDAPIEDVLQSYVLDLAEVLGWGRQMQVVIQSHNMVPDAKTKPNK